MTLDELPIGRPARVTGIDGRGRAVMLRLMEMGLVPGATVRVRKRAPFRGPLELRLGGYLLSIRAAEAQLLAVEPESAAAAPAAERVAESTLRLASDEAA